LPLVSSVGDEVRLISASIGMVANSSIFPQSSSETYFPLLYYIQILALIPYVIWLLIVSGGSLAAVKASAAFNLGDWLIVGRLVSLILGVAAVYLVYLIGRKIFNSRAPAYLAALLMALDPLNVALSHFGRVWEAQVFFILLALYFSLSFWADPESKPSIKKIILTAVFILCSLGVNLIGLFSYACWLVVLLVYRFNFNWPKLVKFFLSRPAVIFHSLLVVGGLLIIYLARYSLDLYKSIWQIFFSRGDLSQIAGLAANILPLPWWQKIILSLNIFFQLETLAFIGLIPALFLIRRENKKLFYFLLLSLVLFFVGLNPPLLNSARSRHLALMMPLIILTGAWLLSYLFFRFKKISTCLAIVLVVLFISPAVFIDLRNDFLLDKNSTRFDLYHWLKDKNNDNIFVLNGYLSQDFLPKTDLISAIKKYSPQYYSSRLKYIEDNFSGAWTGGYNLYSYSFFCQWPPEEILKVKFKYVVIYKYTGDQVLDLKICGLIPIDLSSAKLVFYRSTAPFYDYNLTDGDTTAGSPLVETYYPLAKIKQFGPGIEVYQIN